MSDMDAIHYIGRLERECEAYQAEYKRLRAENEELREKTRRLPVSEHGA